MVTLRSVPHCLFLSVLLLCIAACSGRRFDNPSQPLSQYTLRQNQGGVELAIDPFVEPPRLQQYFVRDVLRDFHILPIFVVMRNGQDAPLLVQNGRYEIADANGRVLAQSATTSAFLPLLQEWGDVRDAFQPCMDIWPGCRVIYEQVAIGSRHYREVVESIFNRALSDKVVFKGESHAGFIYFGLQDFEMLRSIRALRVEFKTTTTDHTFLLTCELDLSKGGIDR